MVVAVVAVAGDLPAPLLAARANDLGGADTRAAFDSLLAVYAPIAAVVFLIVMVALLVPLSRNRASNDRVASKRTSSVRLEALYAVVLGVVAGLLVWRTFEAVTSVDAVAAKAAPAPRAGPSGLTIDLAAAKWNWRFGYPGGVVEQGNGPDHLPTLVVPSDEVVRFRLHSLDVVHAFWIPAARYKWDAIPGHPQVIDMAFDPDVDYRDGRCSEFCGEYHEQMRFKVDVRNRRAFDAWLSARQRQAAGG